MRSIQAIVIGHDLMSFCVRKHLVAAQTMAIAAADFLVRLSAHCVQAILRFNILNLEFY